MKLNPPLNQREFNSAKDFHQQPGAMGGMLFPMKSE
jgi:hypothetical protein